MVDGFVRAGWQISIRSEAIKIDDTVEMLRFTAIGSKEGPIGLFNHSLVPWAVLLQSSMLDKTHSTTVLSSDSKHKLMRDLRALIPVSSPGDK